MGRSSSITTLPPETRADLDKRLAEGRFTLDSLVDFLADQGHAISRSALGRYSKKFDDVAAKLRESREVASAFAQELGAVPNDEMGQMLVEMVHTLVFKASLGQSDKKDADVKAMDVMLLAKALKDLAGSKQISVKLALEIRAEEKKRLEAEMKAKLSNAQHGGGLSKEAALEARRILGFGDD